jgi:hypothetical protein
MISRKQNTDMGILLSLVLLIVGISSGWTVLYKITVAVLLITALFPVVFTPLSRVWYGAARLLERVMSTIILFLIFYLVVTPVGLLRRYIGKDKDALRIRSFQRGHTSVFEIKNKVYKAEDLENQF